MKYCFKNIDLSKFSQEDIIMKIADIEGNDWFNDNEKHLLYFIKTVLNLIKYSPEGELFNKNKDWIKKYIYLGLNILEVNVFNIREDELNRNDLFEFIDRNKYVTDFT